MRSVASVCLSVCLSVCRVRALITFESHGPETSFQYTGTSSEYLGQIHLSRSSGQGQGHRNKTCLCVLFVGGLHSTEKRSCSLYIRIFCIEECLTRYARNMYNFRCNMAVSLTNLIS